jgi:hypothetical protein
MAISYSGCTCGAGGGGGGECECPPTCVTTTCVLRCDDTTGDGLPDTTYSELWCIQQDGTSQLVLTYQGDPSEPYTPVSPVDCEHGTMQCHTELLCDDSGRPFLRKFTFLSNGTAAYLDVEVDGETPHVVIGTVRSCDGGSDCAEQHAPVATLGLCLADGTPIGVLVTRDCDGAIRQEGWLNLATGAYSAGRPPAGVVACGTPRSVSTTGTFCDVDPGTGTVYGLVLIEYTYSPDGGVSGVRIVDATTGQLYTPQGEITTCPAGVAQPEKDLVVLCETRADGSVRRILRDYMRDENGQITGHTDYTLDGAAYTPSGAVDVCDTGCDVQNIIQAERCDDTDGDGQPDTTYIELLAVDCEGNVTSLATRTCDLADVYEPVAPIDCDTDDGEAPAPEPCGSTFEMLCDVTADGQSTPFLRKITTTCSGYVLDTADVTLDGVTPYRVTGTVGVCGPDDCPVTNLVQAERCDDTNGDGIADVTYTEMLGVDCAGNVTSLGTYLCDLSGPYTPTAPVDCDSPDAVPERPIGVQAHRVELAAGQTWTAAAHGTLRAVQATAWGGTGTITTADGTSTLHDGETAQWSITRDVDVRLIGPLTIEAATGAITINWTTGVDL